MPDHGVLEGHAVRAQDRPRRAYDVGNARIWGGIHYRSAVEDAIVLGKKAVNQVLSHHFRRSS